jgi:hypothetical protein
VQHCDPDVLGLAALGEEPAPRDAEHLRTCATCSDDVARLREVTTTVRVDVPAGPALAPPPRVWEAIAARTGVATAPRPEFVRGTAAPPDTAPGAAPVDRPAVGPAAPMRSLPGGAGSPELGEPGRARGRGGRRAAPAARSWRWPALAAAALVVGAVAGSAVTWAVSRDAGPTDPGRQAARQVLVETPLEGLELAPDASGRAEIVRATTGGRLLDVDVSRLGPLQGQFYEVWLIDRGVRKMVPVGILHGATGEFVIPDALDVSAYPIVDISVETPGDPRHSGRSVLRGTIPERAGQDLSG